MNETFGGMVDSEGPLSAVLTEDGKALVFSHLARQGTAEQLATLLERLRRHGLPNDAQFVDDYPVTDVDQDADPEEWITVYA